MIMSFLVSCQNKLHVTKVAVEKYTQYKSFSTFDGLFVTELEIFV